MLRYFTSLVIYQLMLSNAVGISGKARHIIRPVLTGTLPFQTLTSGGPVSQPKSTGQAFSQPS